MTTETSTPVLVVMLKAPRPGFVKTRLAREIGAEAAAAVYRRLVEHQLSMAPPEWRVEIHFTPADAGEEMQQWLGSSYAYYPQANGDLGERLVHATASAFARRAVAAIVIGGDCPDLDETCLREAWQVLKSADVVLGPALDGGYYLIGLRRPLARLFRAIPWSSPAVLEVTMERARKAGLSPALLATKEDVDNLATWRRIHPTLPRTVAAAFPGMDLAP